MAPGELFLYSDGGASIYLRKDGSIFVEGPLSVKGDLTVTGAVSITGTLLVNGRAI